MNDEAKRQRQEEIGRRVRSRRKELRLTQDDLRLEAGLSKSFLSEIESGKRAASGLNYLQLAEALDVDIGWLLKGDESASTRAVPSSSDGPPAIHAKLAKIAEDRDWTYAMTAEAASMLNAVCARRTRGGIDWEPSDAYLERLAKMVEGT